MLTKKSKKKKVRTITSLRKQCVEIAKEVAKIRDRYICVRCGRSKLLGSKIDGSHVMPESHFHSLSADIENIKALCFKCHEWWHLNPCESGKWFAGKFPDRFANLTRKARENKIIDRVGWEKMLVKLKKMLPKD